MTDPYFLFFVAIIVGLVIGYFLKTLTTSSRQKAFQTSIDDLKAENHALKAELESRSEEVRSTRQELKENGNRIIDLSSENAKLSSENAHWKEKLETQKQEVQELRKKFTEEFENIANRIFDAKSDKFTRQNQVQLESLLNPLKEKIGDFEKKVTETNTEHAERHASLKTQIQSLESLNKQITQEARNLTDALKGDSKTQGNWGEMQLETLLNYAGLEKDIHYRKEAVFKNEDGQNQRLDYLLRLPDDKYIIIDSKVSLTAYARYHEAVEDTDRSTYLKQHLASLDAHIKTLSDRNYQQLYEINQPDYVMLFVANEPALTLALKEDKGLYERALSRNIVLVSSTTLLAVLKTISYIWKQELQSQNAREIARMAGKLYDKFVGLVEDLDKLGGQLETVDKTYKRAVGKLSEGRGNLIRKVEELRRMGADTSKRLPDSSISEDEED
ncbi:MAG: DNA recombination protein RmuC [Bacteroidota bacterium]|nr:DNA recombination protein RmuC [Bacteroidota bacterium]